MPDRFDTLVQKTLKSEGGYFENKATGEIVNHGVSLKVYALYHPEATKKTIKNLTKAAAVEFYREHYWLTPGIYRLADDPLAQKVFDLGVNIGDGTEIRLLQQAVVEYGRVYGFTDPLGVDLAVDGKCGPDTGRIANSCDPVKLLALVRKVADAHYHAVVQAKPALASNLSGWLQRLYS